MPAARAEIGDRQLRELLQAVDLLPDPRHGAGIEHLQLEAAHAPEHAARAQLVQDRERRDLPHRGLDPGAVEGELVLAVALLELVLGEAELLEPVHEVRREHLPAAVEGVAAQPGRLAAGEPERADVVELLAQLALVDDLGEAHAGGAVLDPEGDRRVAMAPEDRLRHQELVEIGVDHRAHDRVDLPGVIVDPGRDVDHRLLRGAKGRLRPYLGMTPVLGVQSSASLDPI